MLCDIKSSKLLGQIICPPCHPVSVTYELHISLYYLSHDRSEGEMVTFSESVVTSFTRNDS